jgi:hypothetical protein
VIMAAVIAAGPHSLTMTKTHTSHHGAIVRGLQPFPRATLMKGNRIDSYRLDHDAHPASLRAADMAICRRARHLTAILPAMTVAEALETTRIHRVAGVTGDSTAQMTIRPCCASLAQPGCRADW